MTTQKHAYDPDAATRGHLREWLLNYGTGPLFTVIAESCFGSSERMRGFFYLDEVQWREAGQVINDLALLVPTEWPRTLPWVPPTFAIPTLTRVALDHPIGNYGLGEVLRMIAGVSGELSKECDSFAEMQWQDLAQRLRRLADKVDREYPFTKAMFDPE